MSAMNNAPEAQKTQREKQQPDSRYKMGLLEKQNNYKLRIITRKEGVTAA